MAEIVPINGSKKQLPASAQDQAIAVLEFLNKKTGKHFKPTQVNLKFIIDRMHEGYTAHECCVVVVLKCREWLHTDMAIYLRPSTLFNCAKFNSYAGEIGVEEDS